MREKYFKNCKNKFRLKFNISKLALGDKYKIKSMYCVETSTSRLVTCRRIKLSKNVHNGPCWDLEAPIGSKTKIFSSVQNITKNIIYQGIVLFQVMFMLIKKKHGKLSCSTSFCIARNEQMTQDTTKFFLL